MMPEQTEEVVARKLVEALERLHEDLDRVELWTAALSCFQRPALDYEPGEQYALPPFARPAPSKPGRADPQPRVG